MAGGTETQCNAARTGSMPSHGTEEALAFRSVDARLMCTYLACAYGREIGTLIEGPGLDERGSEQAKGKGRTSGKCCISFSFRASTDRNYMQLI